MKFKEYRKKCNLTQAAVATILGVARGSYTNLENGRREADYDTLKALSELFKTTIDDLLDYSDANDGESMINNRLRLARESANLSQMELANFLCITRQAYNHYETGRREPTLETLRLMAEKLGVSSDYLLGIPTQNEPATENEASPQKIRFLFKLVMVKHKSESILTKSSSRYLLCSKYSSQTKADYRCFFMYG